MKIAVAEKKKNDERFFVSRYFSGGGLCLTHVGAPCCETWLKFGFEVLRCKKNEERNIWVVGYPVSWAPCCK